MVIFGLVFLPELSLLGSRGNGFAGFGGFELLDHVLDVGEILDGLPSGVLEIPAFPLDEVLVLVWIESGVLLMALKRLSRTLSTE